MKKSIVAMLCVGLMGCISTIENKTDQQTPEEPKSVTLNEGIDDNKVIDTLTIDWSRLKTTFRFLNCGARVNDEKSFFKNLDEKQLLYEYCAHNGNQELSRRAKNFKTESKLIEAIVVKTNGEVGKYSDKNEQLIFLTSVISAEELGLLNIVGMEKEALIERFGNPESKTDNVLCYRAADQLLLVKLSAQKVVERFKYYPLCNEQEINFDQLTW